MADREWDRVLRGWATSEDPRRGEGCRADAPEVDLGKAGGHRWRYARGCQPRGEGPEASGGRLTERERWRLATLWPRYGRDWDGWAEALPGRTPDAIEAMARKMGLRPKPRRGAWTRAEETVLLRGLMGMARETGRTPGAIVARLGHLRSAAKREGRGR